MDGDIETRPLIYREEPIERAMTLFGPAGRQYDAERHQRLTQRLDELERQESTVIRRSAVTVDLEAGRLAVGLVVYGTHSTLHKRAPQWLSVLQGTDTETLGYAWQIGH